MFDLKMRLQNRNVCLVMDNYPGHRITYRPTHVRIEVFEQPVLQPLDAGIIRCFKAHYQRAFFQRALDLDNAEELDIYKISLHEAMLMAKEAWDAILSTTIERCWTCTHIQQDPVMPHTLTPSTLAQAPLNLRGAPARHHIQEPISPPKSPSPTPPRYPPIPQLEYLKAELATFVAELTHRDRISGPVPTVDELIDSTPEGVVLPRTFGGDDEIISQVRLEQDLRRREINDIASDEGEDTLADLPTTQIIEMCKELEVASLKSTASSALEVSRSLRRFRAQLIRIQWHNAKQVTLSSMEAAR
jgi:hypothetical protein